MLSLTEVEELVTFLAQNLVEQPEQVQVYSKDLRRMVVVKLQVAQEDTGRVVGKQGRVANAMRSLIDVVTRDAEKPIVLEID